MKTILHLLLSVLTLSSVNGQYVTSYTPANGLLGGVISDIHIENDTTMYIATDKGLSFFDGTRFTDYTVNTSGLNSNDIKELEYAYNKLWIVTDLGLSVFDGNLITNYSTSNGLISNNITGLTATSNGDLWIGSINGVSKYDGTQFIHDSARVAYDIEADTNDNIYVVKYPAIFDTQGIPSIEIYNGTSWTTPPFSNFQGNYDPKIIKTSKGRLVIHKTNSNLLATINYPLNLNNFTLDPSKTFPRYDFSAFEDINDKVWVNYNNGLYQAKDSMLTEVLTDPPFSSPEVIKKRGNKVYIGNVDGFHIIDERLPVYSYDLDFDANLIKTSVSSFGPLFLDSENGRANFEYPKDSNSFMIYSANFIVSAWEQLRNVVHPTLPFGQTFKPGPINNAPGLLKPYMAKVSQQEILAHRNNFASSNYTMPKGILQWPANGDSITQTANDLAPFFDANSNGCYDPLNGDYPIIKGDEAIYWINHPADKSIDFEYHWMIYAFDGSTDPDLNHNIYLQYRIINRGTANYDSVKVGLFLDPDLGNPTDDYVGSDSLNNIVYAYNGDQFDESFNGQNGYRSNIPAVGAKYLSDSMATSVYYNIGGGPNGAPFTFLHWDNYLSGRWKNGQSMVYGGDGLNSTGTTSIPTNYMFTGDPLARTGWTEFTPGGSANANQPGDRRILSSITPFSLGAGQSKTIEVSIGAGRLANPTNYLQNIREMKRILNYSKAVWDTITTPSISYGQNFNCNIVGLDEQNEEVESNLLIYPNPANNSITVKSDFKLAEITLYDLQGRLLMKIDLNAAEGNIDLSNLPDGVYLLNTVDTEGRMKNNKLILSR